MKKNFLAFAVLFLTVSVFAQNLQYEYYTYSDLAKISAGKDGKTYITSIGTDLPKEISVTIDEYGFKKLVNEDFDLYILDGGWEYFISPKIKVTETIKFPDGIYRIPDCHLNGRGIKNIVASSTLTDKYHTYSPEGTLAAWYTGDCDIWGFVKDNLPWVEGKDDYGIGEYLEFETDDFVYTNGKKRNYDGWIISILNGYVNPEKPHLYKQNSRIKTATLVINGKQKIKVTFNDCVEITRIKIPGTVDSVRIIIDEVYQGTKYSDTCITGIAAEIYTVY